MDAATMARLRDEAWLTRDQIEQLLADAGYGHGGPSLAHVDAGRDLDPATDIDLETLSRIDELHAERRSSTSERSRQRAERVLNEIMHRVIDGYQVEDQPPNRAIKAGRGVEAVVARAYLRASLLGGRTGSARRWRAIARVALMALAFGSTCLLAAGHVATAAGLVAARTVVAAISSPPPPTVTRHRWMSYNPDWLGGAVLNIGDAVILAGIGIHLGVVGRTAWAASTVAAALLGLSAAYIRVAAHQEGLRLPRLWIDRLAKDIALNSAVVLAAAGLTRGPDGVPALAVAPIAVAVMGGVELVRVAYYVRLYHERIRRVAKTDGTLAADTVVLKTDDALVYRIPLSGRHRPMLDGVPATAGGRRPGARRGDHSGGRSGGPPDLRAVPARGG